MNHCLFICHHKKGRYVELPPKSFIRLHVRLAGPCCNLSVPDRPYVSSAMRNKTFRVMIFDVHQVTPYSHVLEAKSISLLGSIRISKGQNDLLGTTAVIHGHISRLTDSDSARCLFGLDLILLWTFFNGISIVKSVVAVNPYFFSTFKRKCRIDNLDFFVYTK